MTDDEIDRFVAELQKLQPWMTATTMAAWTQVLAGWDPDEATMRLIEVQGEKDRVTPADFNPDAGGGAASVAWAAVQTAVARLGAKEAVRMAASGDLIGPVASQAVMAVRRELQSSMSGDRIWWKFRDAYASAAAGGQAPDRLLGAGDQAAQLGAGLPMIGRRVE